MKRTAVPANPELVVHHHFHLPPLGRSRTIRVLLPRHYFQNPHQRYPVIYLQDGQNLFDPTTAAFKHWRLREIMARQPLKRQAILVGIDHGGIDRLHEYSPQARGRSTGQGHAYLQSIAHSLKPFIDHHYRTLAHPEATGIMGASMGGLIALYAGMRFGHVFGKVASLSPSLWFNPGILQLASQNQAHQSRYYIAGSRTETRGMASTLENTYWAFKKGGLPDEQLRVVIRDRGRHSEVFWGREFKGAYEWLF